jgi:GT2 family glycosyltransferase
MSALLASVAVSSRNRPLRLRWLLNALAEQTFAPDRFEVIVAHDSSTPETDELLRSHPLAATGRLRELRFADGSVLPAAKRDAAWRAAQSPLILFTDDDCRPAPDWIERIVAAASAHPGAIVQGMTVPDPDETATLLGAPWAHTQLIEPISVWAETCNIAYPRDVLERVGGFRPDMGVGEDTDLALRARAAGVSVVGAREVLVYHAVQERLLPGAIRSVSRWSDFPLLVRRHPELRSELSAGIWWKPQHAALAALIAGAAFGRTRNARAILAAPWLALSMRHRGYGPRGVARSLTELPGRAAIDLAETVALARGSVRHRALVL